MTKTETLDVHKKIPVMADVDVLVAGGGISGCTAAVTAARHGIAPRQIDVKELQRLLLHKHHAPLDEPERLKQLGIV